MTPPLRPLVLAIFSLLLGGCESLRSGARTCAIQVIVDGNERVATPEQIAYVEARVGPLLSERGLTFSRDRNEAAFLAQVELQHDPQHPREGDFVVRTIEPNPLRGTVAAPEEKKATPEQREEQRRSEQFDRSLYEEGRKSGT